MNDRYGLKFEEIKREDYKLGGYSFLPREILQENQDWTAYLPKKEHQNLNSIEPYACVVYTILNCVEILIKRKYNEERNFSDRFLACVVNTRNKGTTPQKACEFLRKIGVCKEDEYPYDALTEDEYFKELDPKLYELAREFNREFSFKHEYVEGKDIDEALKYSPLLISVFAWYRQGDIYVKKGKDNHATTYIKRGKDHRLVFDSYGPDLKKIHLDAIPKVAKRFWLEKRPIRKLTFCQWLKRLWRK